MPLVALDLSCSAVGGKDLPDCCPLFSPVAQTALQWPFASASEALPNTKPVRTLRATAQGREELHANLIPDLYREHWLSGLKPSM